MKKIAIAALILLLVFASCADTSEPPKETSAYMPYIFTIEGELPDIGAFSGKAKQERFYEAYTPDFIPSDEYGEIIPYIGGYKTYSTTGKTPIDEEYATYGFCTLDGRIVMDASSKNHYISYRESDDGFGYYTVSRGIAQRDDAPDEYYTVETLIIPRSGEWCLTLDPNSWATALGGGVISVSVYSPESGSEKCEIYNYSGEKISVIEDVSSLGQFSHGLIGTTAWGDNGSVSYYIDIGGNAVLGPYESVGDFTEHGVAAVTDQSGESYLIDTSGNRLTDKNYKRINLNRNWDNDTKFFIAWYEERTRERDVYDTRGNYLGSIDGAHDVRIYLPRDDEIIYCCTDTLNRSTWKRFSDHTEFKSIEFGVSPNELLSGGNLFLYQEKLSDRAIFFDSYGETVAVIEDFGSFMEVSGDNRFITYNPSDRENICIYDTAADEVICTVSSKDGGYASFVGEKDRYVYISTYDLNRETHLAERRQVFLYDTNTRTMLFEGCDVISVYNFEGRHYFSVCKNNLTMLCDDEKNIILKIYSE